MTALQTQASEGKATAMFLLRFLAALLLGTLVSCKSAPKSTGSGYKGPQAALVNGDVVPPSNVPSAVKRAIQAANEINHLPYQFGGGHGRPCYGLDCSGSTSHVLRHAGLLKGSMPSKGFLKYGKSGPGKYITIYVRDGHVFMTICGVRFDTTSGGSGHVGPRWMMKPRSTKGFKLRHPPGL
jgi:hypothetical protein